MAWIKNKIANFATFINKPTELISTAETVQFMNKVSLYYITQNGFTKTGLIIKHSIILFNRKTVFVNAFLRFYN